MTTLKQDALSDKDIPRVAPVGKGVASLPGWLTHTGAMAAYVVAILLSNYALQNFPNVKLFDMLVFLAGYTLGFRRGAMVGAAAWLVYGTFNPFGPSGAVLLGVEMTSEAGYALAGALAGRLLKAGEVRLLPSKASLLFAAAAVLSTVAYDVATNVYTGLVWAGLAGSTEYARWVWVALSNPGALYFMAAHISSNLVFFVALAPMAIVAGRRLGK
ncbi:MAG: hypothetical protein HYU30_09660 [Chloroflexi bacterium]|nr:hypothetical protein [Chloroflexota bacterium]